MKALDLFCGAGGASMGLSRAGFEVTGVDIKPQPHYPFRFEQADAMTFPLDGYDFIWASPPCQAYTKASLSQRNLGKTYPDLLPSTRKRLIPSGVPWVIENVPGAPMRADLILCGSLFGLRLVRHRWFEFGFEAFNLVHGCAHHPTPISVVGHGTPTWNRAKNGGKCYGIGEYRAAMGIDWMNRDELSQAIPPAYGEFVGRAAIDYLSRHRALVGSDP